MNRIKGSFRGETLPTISQHDLDHARVQEIGVSLANILNRKIDQPLMHIYTEYFSSHSTSKNGRFFVKSSRFFLNPSSQCCCQITRSRSNIEQGDFFFAHQIRINLFHDMGMHMRRRNRLPQSNSLRCIHIRVAGNEICPIHPFQYFLDRRSLHNARLPQTFHQISLILSMTRPRSHYFVVVAVIVVVVVVVVTVPLVENCRRLGFLITTSCCTCIFVLECWTIRKSFRC
mmetsp:Transcript_96393/g.269722  ORF Transcript_96393/g.269722 Transcript_96393/m.269722 type:complete len:230 (-) Transcript_96393:228-917(-)